MQQPTYIIIQDKTIHHEGDERSRTYPGHGYPAWSETVQTVRYFKDEDEFQNACFALTKASEKYRAFECEEFIIKLKQTLELVRK